jgi:hypothetical protein
VSSTSHQSTLILILNYSADDSLSYSFIGKGKFSVTARTASHLILFSICNSLLRLIVILSGLLTIIYVDSIDS